MRISLVFQFSIQNGPPTHFQIFLYVWNFFNQSQEFISLFSIVVLMFQKNTKSTDSEVITSTFQFVTSRWLIYSEWKVGKGQTYEGAVLIGLLSVLPSACQQSFCLLSSFFAVYLPR